MKKFIIPFSILCIAGMSATAQATTETVASPGGLWGIFTDPITYLLIFTMIILLSTILVMARIIKLLLWKIAGAPKQVEKPSPETVKSSKPSLWARLDKKMTDAVPLEKEADVLLDHDYDGIKELDNNLPPWWKYGFYLTIVFAFIYIFHFHVSGGGKSQLDEYNEQLAQAEQQKTERLKTAASNVDETTVTLLTSESDMSSGSKIYSEKCLVCHGKAGEGLVGPNLTDDYWIHGGTIKDVFKIIKYGFPSKGMLEWQGQLTPVQIQQVASFIKSIKGTNPPGAKEPQGDLFKETESTSIATDTTVIAAVLDSTSTKNN